MYGGLGNDTYYVDNAGDYIAESSDSVNGGVDTVVSSVTRTLGSYQENLTLTGSTAINGMGNSLANVIKGNGAENLLSGGAGADSIYGGLGNDTLIGGLGKDLLAGGDGKDTFGFNGLSEMGIFSSTWDVISDFVRGQDKIDLRTLDADEVLVGVQAFSAPVVGGSFSGVFANPRDLYFDSIGAILYGNTDQDSAAEFAIQLTWVSTLTTADLFL